MKSEITYLLRLNYLSLSLSKNARILDVGCGKGVFVKLAKKAGHIAFGYDIAQNITADYHRLSEIPNYYFEAITCFDVIEHTDNPLKFIKNIKTKLKPKGLLLLTTPNRNGIAGRMIKNKFRGINPGGHQKVFNLPEIKRLFEVAGFEVLEAKTDILAWWYLSKNQFLNKIINKIVYVILFPFKNYIFSLDLGDNLQILSRIKSNH